MSASGNEPKTIILPPSITVRELSERLKSSPIDVIKTLMANGVMANINQQIDFDTAAIVAAELGYEASLEEFDATAEEDLGEIPVWRQLIAKEKTQDLTPRPPVVTILGHVDHGKTTLLDAIRETNVAGGEYGGITQHIGAYQIQHEGRTISFLDTPGHAAFTAMRARGAQGADVVVLVVAADDGVMPQTKEAIAHAKAAHVPIVVALNKMDRPNADKERAKQQLAEAGLIPDDWDGDTIIVPLSAKEKTGLDDLMEAILLVADNQEILANPEGTVFGTVIEAERDRARGVLATLLVQNGTLKLGDVVVAGLAHGRIRAMFNYLGQPIKEAGPSMPVSVMGLNDVPAAGDLFELAPSEREARVVVKDRQIASEQAAQSQRQTVTLEQLFARFEAGEDKELRLIVKADVQGSLEPIISSLNDLGTNEISIHILHSGTGNISESDIMLAATSKAIVIGFNVEPDTAAQRAAETEGVSVRTYNIIYRLTEDIEKALKGMLEPEERQVVIGKAEVLAVFRASRLGQVAGCRVLEGELRRNGKLRVLRDEEPIFEGDFASLKRHQDDVREVRQGFECGVGVRNFNEFEIGDILECYVTEKVAVI
jgi:translation initiation factor IF-2